MSKMRTTMATQQAVRFPDDEQLQPDSLRSLTTQSPDVDDCTADADSVSNVLTIISCFVLIDVNSAMTTSRCFRGDKALFAIRQCVGMESLIIVKTLRSRYRMISDGRQGMTVAPLKESGQSQPNPTKQTMTVAPLSR